MKLKHLFLASLVVCAFASCSDDSSNGIDIPDENYQMIETNVSLTATALDGIKTKADATTDEGSGNERFIHELPPICSMWIMAEMKTIINSPL